MKGEREVGGLRCSEVLAVLPDVVEGTLAPDLGGKVRAHVAGCDICASFGGAYGEIVRALRERLSAEPLDPDVADRLARRLAKLE